jgi:hypothetical protein
MPTRIYILPQIQTITDKTSKLHAKFYTQTVHADAMKSTLDTRPVKNDLGLGFRHTQHLM